MPESYPATPTLNKIKEHQEESQAIGEFLDWLHSTYKRVAVCEYRDAQKTPCPRCGGSGIDPLKENPACLTCGRLYPSRGEKGTGIFIEPAGYYPIGKTPDQLLHEYFGINADTEEKERRAVLDYVRKQVGQ